MAEVAFTVIDAHQNKGLGTILLAVLYVMAQPRGVQVLRAIVLTENTRVIKWFRSLGATESWSHDECRLDLHVQPSVHAFRAKSGESFRQAIGAVQALVTTPPPSAGSPKT